MEEVAGGVVKIEALRRRVGGNQNAHRRLQVVERRLDVVAVEPASAVIVDDTPRALRQAAAVGVRTVLVNEEGAGAGEFDATIARLAELPALLSARGWRPKSSVSSC